MPHRDSKWQALVLDRSAATQDRFRNCGYLIELGIARVDRRQFHPPRIFGKIFRVAYTKPHVALDREKIGEQSSREHDDQSRVSEMNPKLAPGPLKTFRVRREQIDEQDCANEMAARENRNLKTVSFRRPPDEKALEITLLRFPNSQMHLGNRSRENQHHSRDQAN